MGDEAEAENDVHKPSLSSTGISMGALGLRDDPFIGMIKAWNTGRYPGMNTIKLTHGG
jgi:hypothetical protein